MRSMIARSQDASPTQNIPAAFPGLLLLILLVCSTLDAQVDLERVQLSCFQGGAGPRVEGGAIHLLDRDRTPLQSNAAAFPCEVRGVFQTVTFSAKLRVLKGGDGGSVIFLNTTEFGVRGPAPFLKSWVEPNLAGTFAVGIDVHNPPDKDPFSPWGNYQDKPQREVSLHWNGREIVKRLAHLEFRHTEVPLLITLHHVVGGAEVTVRIGEGIACNRFFIAGLLPYESRLCLGAGTRAKATTEFTLRQVKFTKSEAAAPTRTPLHVEVFHHVMTNNSKVAYTSEVDLPPADWAFGRVILTLDIHDGGRMWDEWDRNGDVSIITKSGRTLSLVPFITSYRTPCHWEVDVTHFRPLLSGRTKFEIRTGTTFYKNRGYAMSVSLDYYHGRSDTGPFKVIPLWVGNAHYKSHENHFQDFFKPQTVHIPEETTRARLFMTTTGHSQVGEFTPSRRSISVRPFFGGRPGPKMTFPSTLWKTDCYLNPNRPQFGTWKYSRAGWAPGDIVHPWWLELMPPLRAGHNAEIGYRPEPYDFFHGEEVPADDLINRAMQTVRSYLILYRRTGAQVAAPIVRVTKVVDGSAAAKAGIRRGDYLARYDGQALESIEDLRSALDAALKAKKKEVKVLVFRGSERLTITMPPGRMGVNLALR